MHNNLLKIVEKHYKMMQDSGDETAKKEFESQYYEKKTLWDPDSIKEVDKSRIDRVLELIPKESESLLDIGCGNGILCNRIEQKKSSLKRVVGFDRSLEALKYVKTEKRVGEIDQLPFKNKEFDIVCALEVLEHLNLETFELALKEISRVAKKKIIITVPFDEKLDSNMTICNSCHKMFNRNYHMQTFNIEKMKDLFVRWNFNFSLVKPIGKKKEKLFRNQLIIFSNLIHGKKWNFQKYKMKHAVCPFCGFQKENYKEEPQKKSKFRNSLKRFWPEKEKYIWILASYEKN